MCRADSNDAVSSRTRSVHTERGWQCPACKLVGTQRQTLFRIPIIARLLDALAPFDKCTGTVTTLPSREWFVVNRAVEFFCWKVPIEYSHVHVLLALAASNRGSARLRASAAHPAAQAMTRRPTRAPAPATGASRTVRLGAERHNRAPLIVANRSIACMQARLTTRRRRS